MPVQLPETPETFHCCLATGEHVYERFLASRDKCTHSVLLHPVSCLATRASTFGRPPDSGALQVKLCGDEWPREPGLTQHGVPTRPRYGPDDKIC